MSTPAGRPASAVPARHVAIVADGDVPPRAALDAAWPGWADGIDAVVVADGGLARAEVAGLRPTLLVGDLDSLDPARVAEAGAAGLPVHRAAPDKDESDAELALLEAVGMGATRITVLGAFGGPRLDHALANLWLLAHPALAGIDVVLLDAASRVVMAAAPGPGDRATTLPLPGPVGAIVTLLPFGGHVTGVTTAGLQYPLSDEPLWTGPARGLSNVRIAVEAAVTVRSGRLLIVETARPGGGLSSSA